MEDLSLHILDVVENSIAAEAKRVEIFITEDKEQDQLRLEITDDGQGMDKKTLENVSDPFFTSKTTRRLGLGIPLLAQAAKEGGGTFEITSEPGQGTKIKAVFKLSHPDRKPLGDMKSTLKTLIAGNPETEFLLEHWNGKSKFRLDTKEMK